ncbi:MAG: hypothetical protein IIA55_09395, partial [Gemmatimonadetes bacterium]|nr:hypothetical protein [Gemmatimonadota bacterium]
DKHFDKLEPENARGIQSRFLGRKIPITTVQCNEQATLYHIFDRYNTGSEKLNQAEIRNAVYQDHPVHRTLWELSRESAAPGDSADASEAEVREAAVIAQLKRVMRNKKRYGTYDFIGRVMAFTYLDVDPSVGPPSVNLAIRRFYEECDEDHASLRASFVDDFRTVADWYDDDLSFVKPGERSRFHALAATIQMTSAHHLKQGIEERRLSEDKIKTYIEDNWCAFAGIDPEERIAYRDGEVGGVDQPPIGLLQMRQNALNSWGQQQLWLQRIEAAAAS